MSALDRLGYLIGQLSSGITPMGSRSTIRQLKPAFAEVVKAFRDLERKAAQGEHSVPQHGERVVAPIAAVEVDDAVDALDKPEGHAPDVEDAPGQREASPRDHERPR